MSDGDSQEVLRRTAIVSERTAPRPRQAAGPAPGGGRGARPHRLDPVPRRGPAVAGLPSPDWRFYILHYITLIILYCIILCCILIHYIVLYYIMLYHRWPGPAATLRPLPGSGALRGRLRPPAAELRRREGAVERSGAARDCQRSHNADAVC